MMLQRDIESHVHTRDARMTVERYTTTYTK